MRQRYKRAIAALRQRYKSRVAPALQYLLKISLTAKAGFRRGTVLGKGGSSLGRPRLIPVGLWVAPTLPLEETDCRQETKSIRYINVMRK